MARLVEEQGAVARDHRLDHGVQRRLDGVVLGRSSGSVSDGASVAGVVLGTPARARGTPRDVTSHRASRDSRPAPPCGSSTAISVRSSSHVQVPAAKPQPLGAASVVSSPPATARASSVATAATSPPSVPGGDSTSEVPPGLISRSSYVGSVPVRVSSAVAGDVGEVGRGALGVGVEAVDDDQPGGGGGRGTAAPARSQRGRPRSAGPRTRRATSGWSACPARSRPRRRSPRGPGSARPPRCGAGRPVRCRGPRPAGRVSNPVSRASPLLRSTKAT